MSEALQKVWNISLTNIQNPEMKEVVKEPFKEIGFLCNLQNHWFALRKLENKWWNLNSLQDHPSTLTDLYLRYKTK